MKIYRRNFLTHPEDPPTRNFIALGIDAGSFLDILFGKVVDLCPSPSSTCFRVISLPDINMLLTNHVIFFSEYLRFSQGFIFYYINPWFNHWIIVNNWNIKRHRMNMEFFLKEIITGTWLLRIKTPFMYLFLFFFYI